MTLISAGLHPGGPTFMAPVGRTQCEARPEFQGGQRQYRWLVRAEDQGNIPPSLFPFPTPHVVHLLSGTAGTRKHSTFLLCFRAPSMCHICYIFIYQLYISSFFPSEGFAQGAMFPSSLFICIEYFSEKPDSMASLERWELERNHNFTFCCCCL